MSTQTCQSHDLPSSPAYSDRVSTSGGVDMNSDIAVPSATTTALSPLGVEEASLSGVEDHSGVNRTDGDQQVPLADFVCTLAPSPVSTTFARETKFFPGSTPFLPFNDSLSLLLRGESLDIPRNNDKDPLPEIPLLPPQDLPQSPLAQSAAPDVLPTLALNNRKMDAESPKTGIKLMSKSLWKRPVKRVKQLLNITSLFKRKSKQGGGGKLPDSSTSNHSPQASEKPAFALRLSPLSEEERCHHRRRKWYVRNNPDEFANMMDEMGTAPLENDSPP